MSNKFNTHELIERAWCDKTDFEAISETESLNENDVKKILRKNLKKRSYVLWRKRARGRKTKHVGLREFGAFGRHHSYDQNKYKK